MPKPSDWLYFAEGDLIAAKLLIEQERALASSFYHCQQSAEKSLKAYLVYKMQAIHKTHDLASLLNRCKEFDAEFKILADDIYDLNPFSSATRYPDDYYLMPSLDTAKICIIKAERILDFVKNKII